MRKKVLFLLFESFPVFAVEFVAGVLDFACIVVQSRRAVDERLFDALAVESDAAAEVAHVRNAFDAEQTRSLIFRFEGRGSGFAVGGDGPCVVAGDLKVPDSGFRLFGFDGEDRSFVLFAGDGYGEFRIVFAVPVPFEADRFGIVSVLFELFAFCRIGEECGAFGSRHVQKRFLSGVEKGNLSAVYRGDRNQGILLFRFPRKRGLFLFGFDRNRS